MNIKHYLSASAAIALLAACSDYDPGLSNQTVDLTAEEEAFIKGQYATEFANRMGGIDENHTWGFPVEGASAAKTRSTYPNSNQWVSVIKETQSSGDVVTGFTTNGLTVPGFPIVNQLSAHNGEYHVTFPGDTGGKTYFSSEQEIIDYMNANSLYELYSLGDVDLQNSLSCTEVAEVKALFDREMADADPEVDLSTFFVQQIWHGTATHPAADGINTYVGGEQMDWLCAYSPVGYDDYVWEWDEETQTGSNSVVTNHDDHIFDYNNSDGVLQLMYDSSTRRFGFRSSVDGQVHYTFRMVEHKGNYYVGFDFEATGTEPNQQVARDHIFNDWIVKITPARGDDTPTPPTSTEESRQWYRIMCEDLGSSYDFDFNDLVFDVSYEGTAGNYKATIQLQAAGGTLPIYIGKYSEDYEAHRLLSRGSAEKRENTIYSYKPINVASASENYVTAPYYEFTLNTATDNPDDIDIYVVHAGNTATRVIKLPKVGTVTKAPMKICIPGQTTRWMKESKQLDETYSYFRYWVQKESSEYDYGQSKAWNKFGLQNTDRLW